MGSYSKCVLAFTLLGPLSIIVLYYGQHMNANIDLKEHGNMHLCISKNRNPLNTSVSECITTKTLYGIQINDYINISFLKSILIDDDLKKRSDFENIFQKKTWIKVIDAKNTQIQSSGPYSMLSTARGTMEILAAVIERVKSELGKDRISMLDIPCGDMVWMSEFLKARSDVVYTGMDIVNDLILHHKVKYSNYTDWQFINQDIVSEPLLTSYDLVFSRYLLGHLTVNGNFKALIHMSNSKSKYLLVSDNPWRNINWQTKKKGGRMNNINLSLPPYQLIPPICIARAKDVGTGMALYNMPLYMHRYCHNITQLKSFMMCRN